MSNKKICRVYEHKTYAYQIYFPALTEQFFFVPGFQICCENNYVCKENSHSVEFLLTWKVLYQQFIDSV